MKVDELVALYNSGIRDFQNVALKGETLFDLELDNAIFDGADLSGTFIERCDIKNASFKLANLQGASLNEVNLDGSIFDGARLNNAELKEVSIRNTSLIKVNAKNIAVTESYFINSDFSEADLSGGDIGGGDWTRVDFTRANLSNMKVSCSIFDETNYTGAFIEGLVFDNHVKLNNTNLPENLLPLSYEDPEQDW
jgi:uncharacterized protein YjbI with pentapeptide repeats